MSIQNKDLQVLYFAIQSKREKSENNLQRLFFNSLYENTSYDQTQSDQ
jgi:hypothetical protein